MRRTGGLQARGAYKEVPRASLRLALAAPKSSWACTRVRDNLYILVDRAQRPASICFSAEA